MAVVAVAMHAPLGSVTIRPALREGAPGETVAWGGVTVIRVPSALTRPGCGGDTRWVPSPNSGGPPMSETNVTCTVPLRGANPLPPIVMATGLLEGTMAGGAAPFNCVIVGAL